ncbi:hypothetical protein DFR52_1095 [Hoeflea marina]|uniref:Uncharacterized protein n=1 Tax=Hoeflea marina TaxID=274592 RepID=A0A317PCQ1_9HYPH|nr:hypothetical protein [Hoeflea marina]PWV95610.1 hypothetical protein DFR52_1095 [Hoeflea marina]
MDDNVLNPTEDVIEDSYRGDVIIAMCIAAISGAVVGFMARGEFMGTVAVVLGSVAGACVGWKIRPGR